MPHRYTEHATTAKLVLKASYRALPFTADIRTRVGHRFCTNLPRETKRWVHSRHFIRAEDGPVLHDRVPNPGEKPVPKRDRCRKSAGELPHPSVFMGRARDGRKHMRCKPTDRSPPMRSNSTASRYNAPTTVGCSVHPNFTILSSGINDADVLGVSISTQTESSKLL
ncbi:hypothetical protein XAC2203 [Xanthomonas citri pv. citri str. 306]|uniref:Uncharacterized protein n=1 Tax=Xanthomonas axonopodis pv. citri (strain 306) TaxID=190486 RepID=A0AAI7ZFK6_XANAC|nr:hypothetical protein XAC2203 [Xanthomonas citri pv. citri str. 306]